MSQFALRLIMIAIGCAIGGVSRFLLSYFVQQQWGSGFPYPTLIVNLLGSFLIGVCFSLLTKNGLSHPLLNGLLITGFLGGLTTFSSFSLESVELMRAAQFFQLLLYVAISCVGCMSLTFVGLKLVR